MIERVCWLALMLLHVPPALALVRPGQLVALYGVDQASDTSVLMQHRAALFIMIVVICAWAAMRPETRTLASVAVGISMGSFLIIWWASGMPAHLRTIAIADLAGLPVLLFAAWQAVARAGA